MKKTFLRSFFSSFFDLTLEPLSFPSPLVSHIRFFLYFSQTFSTLAKLQFFSYAMDSSGIFPYFFFYSNFANCLYFLKSSRVFFLIFIMAAMIISFPFFQVFLMAFSRYFFNSHRRNESAFNLTACRFILENFTFILIMPLMEILLNGLYCDWFVYANECFSGETWFFILIIGVSGVILANLLGIILIFTNRNFRFYGEKTEFRWNFLRFFLIFLRNMQVFLYAILKEWVIVCYISLYLFAVLSFLDYFTNKPFYNRRNNGIFIRYLFMFSMILLLMTFSAYLPIISSNDLFYLIIILALLALKFAIKLFSKQDLAIFTLNTENIQDLCEILAEIKVSSHKNINKTDNFMVSGVIYSHFKQKCENPYCQSLIIQCLEDKNAISLTEDETNSFIINKLTFLINKKASSKSEMTKKDLLILKYIDFLKLYSINPKKLLFDTQKLKSKLAENSVFLNQFLKNLNFSIKNLISAENLVLTEKNQEETLNLQEFFKANKYKRLFISKIIEILKAEREMWSEYCIGYKEIDILVANVQRITEKILIFEDFAKKYAEKAGSRLLLVKVFSFNFAILQNLLTKSMKFEEEYRNLCNVELFNQENNKNKLSFINNNTVVCEASFLGFDGKLKKNAKSQKLARFFGFSKHEEHLLENISDFMPKFIKEKHHDFVKLYIEKARNSNISKYPIFSFGLHKNQYIFPISLYISIKYSSDDFVIMAAMVYDDLNDDLFIIFDQEGEILGISKKIKVLFDDFASEIEYQEIKIFESIIDLKPKVENAVISNEFLTNQHDFFIIKNFYEGTLTSTEKTNKSNKTIKSDQTIKSKKSQNSSKNRKKQFHFTPYIIRRFAIDFDVKILKYSSSESTVFFNLSIKNIVKVPEAEIDTNKIDPNLILENNYTQKNELQDSEKNLLTDEDNEDNLENKKPNINYLQKKEILPRIITQDLEKNLINDEDNDEDSLENKKECEKVEIQVKGVHYNPYVNKTTSIKRAMTLRITTQDFDKKKGKTEAENEENIMDSFNFIHNDPQSLNVQDKIDLKAREVPILENEKKSLNNVQEKTDLKAKNTSMKFHKIEVQPENNDDFRIIKTTDINQKTDGLLLGTVPINSSDGDQHRDSNKVEVPEPSNHSSAINMKALNFKVFSAIEAVKNYVPRSFYLFFCCVFCEMVLMMAYMVLMQTSMDNYFVNEFYPIQTSIMGLCEQYSGFAFSTGVTNEFEFQYLNITEIQSDTNFTLIYYRIIGRSFESSKTIIYLERSLPHILYYQEIYETEPSLVINYLSAPKTLSTIGYFDLTDNYLNYLTDLTQQDFHQMDYDTLIFLQRNYINFLLPTAAILTEIKAEFLSYSLNIDNVLKNYMVVFIIILAFLKLCEIVFIALLYNVVNRLANIFLRINLNEATSEIRFIDNLLFECQEREDDLFTINFAEKAIEKKNFLIALEQNHNLEEKSKRTVKSGKNSSRKKKKVFTHSNLNISTMSKTKGCFFIVITLILGFSYFFLNYYYWNSFTATLQEIIALDISFVDIYVYSTSVLICNNLLLREQIISNPSYEYLNSIYQQPAGRIGLYTAALAARITTITDIFNLDMPNSVIEAQATVKNQYFQNMLDNNMCDVLFELNMIENDERDICNNIWEGAFHKGLMVAFNQYLQMITDLDYLRTWSAEEMNTTAYENFLTNVTTYFQDPHHQELFMGQYFLSQCLLLFYDYANDFYNPLIEQQRNSEKMTLILTMVGLISLFILAMALLGKYMKRYYKLLAMTLSIIPYEKVTQDEATLQIIEHFKKKLW